jgi:hypothetical protein
MISGSGTAGLWWLRDAEHLTACVRCGRSPVTPHRQLARQAPAWLMRSCRAQPSVLAIVSRSSSCSIVERATSRSAAAAVCTECARSSARAAARGAMLSDAVFQGTQIGSPDASRTRTCYRPHIYHTASVSLTLSLRPTLIVCFCLWQWKVCEIIAALSTAV